MENGIGFALKLPYLPAKYIHQPCIREAYEYNHIYKTAFISNYLFICRIFIANKTKTKMSIELL